MRNISRTSSAVAKQKPSSDMRLMGTAIGKEDPE
jgi:hypothetical protein